MASAARGRAPKRPLQKPRILVDAVEQPEGGEVVEETNYALRLTQALEAISAANAPVEAEPKAITYSRVRKPRVARATAPSQAPPR
ncbi:MAG: hypothetical protein M3336_06550, partial [Chloroflexota bacterium]|nr:hypothetical protein [Chloroflexota bacterium]